MKGQILLVSQIVAQGTKIKAWEIVVTKISILFFVMQKYRTLVFVINLISILQSGHLNESVLLLVLGLGSFCLYHSLYPSGHALKYIITTLLCYSIQSNNHLPPNTCTPAGRTLDAVSTHQGISSDV